ncbi:MAG TPA: hypothetical protein VI818_02070, partial [Candidatus Thermoplasmatota archaeon]|nr:hypothetical protein [Candidatus Thermoplasmatota archaeon]
PGGFSGTTGPTEPLLLRASMEPASDPALDREADPVPTIPVHVAVALALAALAIRRRTKP